MTERQSDQTQPIEAGILEDWQANFSETVKIVGNAVGSSGEALASLSYLRISDSDECYKPMPKVKLVGDEVEVTCNMEAFNEWQRILGGIPELEDSDIRNLYQATAAANVEFTYLAFSVGRERKYSADKELKSRSALRATNLVKN